LRKQRMMGARLMSTPPPLDAAAAAPSVSQPAVAHPTVCPSDGSSLQAHKWNVGGLIANGSHGERSHRRLATLDAMRRGAGSASTSSPHPTAIRSPMLWLHPCSPCACMCVQHACPC
jgi:hypothetical protein